MRFELCPVRMEELKQYKPDMPDDFIGNGSEGFFRFEKYYDSDKHCQK